MTKAEVDELEQKLSNSTTLFQGRFSRRDVEALICEVRNLHEREDFFKREREGFRQSIRSQADKIQDAIEVLTAVT